MLFSLRSMLWIPLALITVVPCASAAIGLVQETAGGILLVPEETIVQSVVPPPPPEFPLLAAPTPAPAATLVTVAQRQEAVAAGGILLVQEETIVQSVVPPPPPLQIALVAPTPAPATTPQYHDSFAMGGIVRQEVAAQR